MLKLKGSSQDNSAQRTRLEKEELPCRLLESYLGSDFKIKRIATEQNWAELLFGSFTSNICT